MEHTKTPWRIGAGTSTGAVVADEAVPEIGGSDAVAYYGGHLIAESIAPRNAAFIVRACNTHDALLEYFRAGVALGNTLGHPDATAADENRAEARYDAARVAANAALRAAGVA
ncbi:hypothetical protein IP91_00092 [Pseudoduganella lurida]|uniref:Uncharacterized protein n=1 Tax=Pseudoduganella lurida TaxID=1036180 RepID=A0A562RIX0_9BURK|nr:hypothetical protein [Pseudoduganella lurida]TWI69027.1 hypothetical protein IP91_00092 [Pseudoduganella lurida]